MSAIERIVEMAEKAKAIGPVTFDVETDGYNQPTHAVMTFGDHPTQAMTMRPEDWQAASDALEALRNLVPDLAGLVEAMKAKNEALDAAANQIRHLQIFPENVLSESTQSLLRLIEAARALGGERGDLS
jgi:hypothetical protein